MSNTNNPMRLSVEIAINLFIIFAIIAWCVQILAPFITFIMWGTVIAISLHGPFCKMRNKMGNKPALAIFTILGLGLVLGPTWLFAGSLIDSAQSLAGAVESGKFDIPPPNDSVKEWPLVGEKAFAAWNSAANNFETFLETYNEQVKSIGTVLIGKVAGLGVTVLLFVLATLIAAAMLSNDASIEASMRRLSQRLVGPERADATLTLTTATIRSVTMGVLGVAFIQAVLGGAGMLLAGVPGAGIWAIAILVLAIAQLPPLVVLLPVIIYVFSAESTTVAVIFMIWSIMVSFSDAILKPMLLGRGVDVPMLVILLGAIGGMLMSGILGLFVGAVILALGYSLYIAWLEMGEEESSTAESGTTALPVDDV